MLVFCYDYFSFHVSYLFHHFFLCWICVQISKKNENKSLSYSQSQKTIHTSVDRMFFFRYEINTRYNKEKGFFFFCLFNLDEKITK